jgi:hypothetical protein
MILFEAPVTALFRYDDPSVSALIRGGSVRVTTLSSCGKAENLAARDSGEGSRTITSDQVDIRSTPLVPRICSAFRSVPLPSQGGTRL